MIKVRMESEDEEGILENKASTPDVSHPSTCTMAKVFGLGIVIIVIGLIGLALGCNSDISDWFRGVQASNDKMEISSPESPTFPQPNDFYELRKLREECRNLLATPLNETNILLTIVPGIGTLADGLLKASAVGKEFQNWKDPCPKCSNCSISDMKYHGAWVGLEFAMKPLTELTARKLHLEFHKMVVEALEKQG